MKVVKKSCSLFLEVLFSFKELFFCTKKNIKQHLMRKIIEKEI